MKSYLMAGASALILSLSGAMVPAALAADTPTQMAQADKAKMSENPFFQEWKTPFGVPPFDAIKPAHFRPAFEKGMADQLVEIKAITDTKAAPTFANTIDAMEKSGQLLDRVSAVFSNLTSSNTNDELDKIQRDMAPLLAAHGNAINLNATLFQRISTLYKQRDQLKLTPEQSRVLERYYLGFVRAGAELQGAQRERMAAILERLAVLSTKFSQNVLADEKGYKLVLTSKDQLAGLPDFVVAAASQAAKDRGEAGKYVITLSRSSIEPFLTFSDNRALREQAWKAWIARGDNGDEHDNNAVITEIVQLRIERANLLGYKTFAEYKLADTMAKNPQAVSDLLMQVWEPAKVRAAEERDEMQKLAAKEGQNIQIEPWDWYYYAEKVRKAKYDLNEEEIKPYFQLDKMVEAMFYTANRLFGVTFTELKGVPTYHPDVKVYEAKDKDGKHLAVFYSDNFARPSKRSGAWMSSLRSQEKLTGDIRPIVLNNNNFAKGAEGQPTLLSFDDATTLFHEFGHGLHGMLSNVTYPQVSGTGVLRDFVEFPSQVLEHWVAEPQILQKFAVHYKTGKPIPKELLDKIIASQTFNQGFATVSYTSSALVDLAYHSLTDAKDLNPDTFERETLTKLGMPKEIVMRHRSPHFSHIFSGDGYSSGYYSYMWAEVLDADGFNAFKEAGDIFDPTLSKKLLENVYSAGGSRDPMEAYIGFRGRAPKVDALLKNRGLLDNRVN
ncbi:MULTISPECIES: M3 family metallopeptidase [unclassified Azospirillum]|uniref:M3 family metallopeptidase n=1 Tax=unclassified Azospirillum TaxID=2630922 RepID=UPI000B72C041|nr:MULTISPECIES: M3 family metallopeptidase [unclassified Azospirillum]SNS54455.1 peptidyl-dipeptidase Dcp [Azospirillum sp. RU38E]SNS73991.1 peptidyl-dipeptidase Dcp [Azospirillum sp. RU37A]